MLFCQAAFSIKSQRFLTFGELEPATGSRLTGFFTFFNAGITPAAVKALQKQMKYLKEQGPVWYRAQGLIYLLSGDERGALTSLEKALKGMDPADPQLKKLTETLRKRVKP